MTTRAEREVGGAAPASTGSPGAIRRGGLVIPAVAWRRPIGLPCPDRSRPRVRPMIDDGEWAGVPLGGLGSGSIGPTFRGDVARWHLEVGRHAFRPVAADGFSLFVRRGGRDGGPRGDAPGVGTARVLSALRPGSDELPAWGWGLPVGAGTYHALFPRAWWTFEPGAVGVRLTGEQLSPVIAGDYESSALPVGTYEWRVENPFAEPVTIGLMLTWRNPLGARVDEPPPAGAWAELAHDDGALGVLFHDGGAGPAGLRGTFAIAVAGADDGAARPPIALTARSRFDAVADEVLWADFAADGALDTEDDPRPAAGGEALGGAACATITLEPGEARSVRFAIAWDLPVTEFGGGRRWWKRYTRAWGRDGHRAWDIARAALRSVPAWRAAIEAWQAPILVDPDRPDWYKAALFNELYFLVDGGSFWEAGEVGGPAPDPDDIGRFALLECLDYPFYDTVDVDFTASSAILELWPELERRGIRDLLATVGQSDAAEVTIEATGARVTRKLPWTVPHDVGGPDEDPFYRSNRYRFQDPNVWIDLAPKLALQVWRDVVRLDDRALAHEARPAVEAALRTLATRDLDRDGLPDHRGIPDQTYDTWPMHGASSYGGLLWLGALRAAEELARLDGDDAAADAWAAMFERGQVSFERMLWQDGFYAFDAEGPSPDTIMADQLGGQWAADVSGLGDLVDPTRAVTALRTIFRRNVLGFQGGDMGAVNGILADGSVDRSSEQSEEVWVGTTYSLAALMLGRGLVEEAWRTASGAARVTYERGLWFRTPEAFDADGNYRASLYLRPLAIWAIEEALRRSRAGRNAGRDAG
ncbi:MAG TPA: non-lysosomal glucosylceramidase [Candidatus Binatia bacterium]|nr:non-lysosomal glucosylceramidase [Candidatus Binatia bacterium]